MIRTHFPGVSSLVRRDKISNTLQGHVDHFSNDNVVVGWVTKDHPEVDIYINTELKQHIHADILRKDLIEAEILGYGFRVSIEQFLEPGPNEIEIRFAGTQSILPNGCRTVEYVVDQSIQDAAASLTEQLQAVPAAVTDASIYAVPREIDDLSECYFYHRTYIPGYGEVGSEWDLRGRESEYLGGVNFQNKRVLELGTASGYLCRYMEQQGADVVGFDMPADASWDGVPFAQMDVETWKLDFRKHIEKLKNGWWLCHRVFNSNANVVYGDIYDIPEQIGAVDIATVGSILLHLRHPFLALENVLRLTKHTVVVTDLVPDMERSGHPVMKFVPDFQNPQPDTWWGLSPEIIVQFMGVLGFENSRVSFHQQVFQDREIDCFTVVGQRTRMMTF